MATPADEADFARTSTSTETSQLLHLLSRSDKPSGILRVAVVGDVHGAWSDADAVAMEALQADLLTFVGDFGNEAVPVVRAISRVGKEIDKRRRSGGGRKAPGVAVVMGNHDAWNSMTARGRERGRERAAAAAAAAAAASGGGATTAAAEEGANDSASERSNSGDPLIPAAASPGVAEQLRLLGSSHVGFSWRSFEDEDDGIGGGAVGGSSPFAAVVGGRPFSQGGPDFRRVDQFYREMYDVEDFEASAEKVAKGLREAAAHLSEKKKSSGTTDDKGTALVLIAHNGPSGLGGLKHDICGADFLEDGGDWGDPDLEEALRRVRGEEEEEATATAVTATSTSPSPSSASPCLVAFGHMHRSLRHASSSYKERNAVEVCAETGESVLRAFFCFFFLFVSFRGRRENFNKRTHFFSFPKKPSES